MATTTSETGRAELLADIEGRMRKAIQIAETAREAGDANKARRAYERYYLRLLQYAHLHAEPIDGWCMLCRAEAGETEIASYDGFWYCLEHYGPVLERKAAELAADLLGGTA